MVTRPNLKRDPRKFDAFAERYAYMAGLLHDHAFFLRNLPARRTRALEIGCGAGRLARVLARRFDKVVAIDSCEPMLALAREDNAEPNLAFLRMDANRIELSGPFDFIASHTTFHHLEHPMRTLAALRHLIAPGGRIAIVDAVSERAAIPAWHFAAGAPLALPSDLVHHGPTAALRLLRFRLSRPWLEHLASDRYLSPGAFRRLFGDALPGAAFEAVGPFLGVVWEAPDKVCVPAR
jgi:SAM-dependent methyltransferase